MTDYTQSTDFSVKDALASGLAAKKIVGQEVDDELDLISTAISSKANKVTGGTSGNLASLTSEGDLQDSSIAASDVSAATLASTGDIKFSVATSLTGWLLCDGTTLGSAASGATHASDSYEDLFNLLKVANPNTGLEVWANDNSVYLPNTRGRVLAGLDNMGGTSANVVTNSTADVMAAGEGYETHTLTTAQMPAHTHTYSRANTDGDAIHSFGAGQALTVTAGVATSSSGSSNAHNNIQPTMFFNVFIKV